MWPRSMIAEPRSRTSATRWNAPSRRVQACAERPLHLMFFQGLEAGRRLLSSRLPATTFPYSDFGGSSTSPSTRIPVIGRHVAGCGLFIDSKILNENRIFPTQRHCDKYHYVFLTQDIERVNEHGKDGFPFPGKWLDDTTMTFPTYAQLVFLKDVYEKACNYPVPKVRSKFQATWNFYKLQFAPLCRKLEEFEFDFREIADANWGEAKSFFEVELNSDYYKFNANQKLYPVVETPVESGKEQGTADQF